MTNEEIAEELRKIALPNPLHSGYGMWLCSSDIDEVLIKMAEWKKQQMIDKACEWLEDNLCDYQQFYFWDKFTETHELDEDKLIEFFKKAMEE